MQQLIRLDHDAAFTRAKQTLVKLWHERAGVLHEIEVREYKAKRSSKANAWYWAALITPAAQQLGYTPEELHRTICCALYGTHRVTLGKIEIEMPNRTTTEPKTMTTEEFAQHIEMASALLAEQGFYVEPFQSAA